MFTTMTVALAAAANPPTEQVLAVADLLQGAKGLYTTGVAILVFACLLAGGVTGVAFLGRAAIGRAIGSVLAGVVLAVLIGSGYAIYLSAKKTTDTHTGITSGQFG